MGEAVDDSLVGLRLLLLPVHLFLLLLLPVHLSSLLLLPVHLFLLLLLHLHLFSLLLPISLCLLLLLNTSSAPAPGSGHRNLPDQTCSDMQVGKASKMTLLPDIIDICRSLGMAFPPLTAQVKLHVQPQPKIAQCQHRLHLCATYVTLTGFIELSSLPAVI